MKKIIHIFTDDNIFYLALVALIGLYPQLECNFELQRISSCEIKVWLQKNIVNKSLIMAGPDMKSLVRFICILNGCQYLQSDFRPEEIQKVLLRVSRYLENGKYILSPSEAKALRPTKQEFLIFSGYLYGLTPYQIAKKHGLSIKTISHHKRSLMKKMQVNSDFQLYALSKKYTFIFQW